MPLLVFAPYAQSALSRMKNVLGSISLLALFLTLTGCERTPPPNQLDSNASRRELAVSISKPLNGTQGTIAALDAKNGFRDATFGDSISQYTGMIQTKDSKELFPDDPTKVYFKKEDKLRLGDADLRDISYFFDQGRLTEVQVWIDGTYDSNKVLEALKYAYGPPTEVKGNWSSWTSKKVFMFYNQFTDYAGKEVAFVQMRSLEMEKEKERQQKVYEEGQLKKAARDL